MIGATEYYFTVQQAAQYGLGGLERTKRGYNLHGGDAECFRKGDILFVTASHARGGTFFIYLIESDQLFEVYGVVRGHRGWTEEYGWLRKGTWSRPIMAFLRDLKREVDAHKESIAETKRKIQAAENRMIGESVAQFNEKFRDVAVI